LTDAQKARLYPSATEKATFAAMLREDGTGIARLLPYVDCPDDPRVVNVKGSCLNDAPPVPGRGSFYSFKREKHEAAPHADLSLHDAEFRIGFANNGVGLMTMLGDVPLEELTLQSSAVAPLLLLAPAPTLDETLRLYKQSRAVLASAHHAYDKAFPAQPNTTYVLRSTTYKSNGRKPSDILVAFRVTRRDSDGSVTIIWKQLRAPKS
jgi:hypothetical protein